MNNYPDEYYNNQCNQSNQYNQFTQRVNYLICTINFIMDIIYNFLITNVKNIINFVKKYY